VDARAVCVRVGCVNARAVCVIVGCVDAPAVCVRVGCVDARAVCVRVGCVDARAVCVMVGWALDPESAIIAGSVDTGTVLVVGCNGVPCMSAVSTLTLCWSLVVW